MKHRNFLFVILNRKHWCPTNFMKRLLHLCTVNNWYLIVLGCFTEVKTSEWLVSCKMWMLSSNMNLMGGRFRFTVFVRRCPLLLQDEDQLNVTSVLRMCLCVQFEHTGCARTGQHRNTSEGGQCVTAVWWPHAARWVSIADLLCIHQFWFQLMHHNFTLLTKSLYMFRAPTCTPSQTYQPYSRHKRWRWTSCGVCIVCPPEDGHVGARNM